MHGQVIINHNADALVIQSSGVKDSQYLAFKTGGTLRGFAGYGSANNDTLFLRNNRVGGDINIDSPNNVELETDNNITMNTTNITIQTPGGKATLNGQEVETVDKSFRHRGHMMNMDTHPRDMGIWDVDSRTAGTFYTNDVALKKGICTQYPSAEGGCYQTLMVTSSSTFPRETHRRV